MSGDASVASAICSCKATIATVLVFVLVGPPVGAMVVLLLRSFFPDFTHLPYLMLPGVGVGNPVSLFLGLIFLLLSYVAGGLQALACGAALAVYGWRTGRFPFWFAIATGLAVFGASYLLLWIDLPDTKITMLIVHLVPVALCWLLARNFWRATA